MGASRPHVYWPQPVEVRPGDDGAPLEIGGVEVEAVRERWLVEDRWWTPKPLQREYFEVVLVSGRDVVVFREPPDGTRWYEQRA
jgi:hypothetical protein